MKQYIGTKLIEAEPAYRVDGKVRCARREQSTVRLQG